MNGVTLVRCGIVWLACVLFLFDGNRLVRAQETLPDSEKNKALNPADMELNASEYSTPDWFEPESEFSDKNRMLFVEVHDASMTKVEAEKKLARKSVDSINRVLAHWLQIDRPETIALEPEYVLQNLVFKDRFQIKKDLECKIELRKLGSDGEAFCGYVQLHLDNEFRSFIQNRYQETTTQKRLVKSGLIGTSILALMVVAFGYLKMETATRGFYSRRLQTISVVAAIGILTVVYWFGQLLY